MITVGPVQVFVFESESMPVPDLISPRQIRTTDEIRDPQERFRAALKVVRCRSVFC